MTWSCKLWTCGHFPSHSVEVDEVTLVLGTTEEWAVVASDTLPGSMEVIGHDVDEVQ